jgi:uncharacterized repeat protein (TIGR01451 family)
VALGIPATSAAATSPPSIASSFVPTSVAVGGDSALSFTITNPNASGSLTGVSFTDTLPSGLVLDNPSGLTGSCGSSSVITANPGGTTISLTGGSVSAGKTCTFSVDVNSNTAGVYQNSTGAVSSANGGTGNSDTESLTVLAPPTISLQTPSNNATYDFGQRVITGFSCQEAANGPGLTGCTGNVDDSDTDLTTGSPLLTSVAGPHTFTVTATSEDGQVVTDTVSYKVRPDNRFTVSRVKAHRNGSVTFKLKLPGPGKIQVRELASGSTFGEKAVRLGRAGTITITVPPGRHGKALVASKPSKLVIQAQITFTPKGGVARKLTIRDVRVI